MANGYWKTLLADCFISLQERQQRQSGRPDTIYPLNDLQPWPGRSARQGAAQDQSERGVPLNVTAEEEGKTRPNIWISLCENWAVHSNLYCPVPNRKAINSLCNKPIKSLNQEFLFHSFLTVSSSPPSPPVWFLMIAHKGGWENRFSETTGKLLLGLKK